MRWGRATLLLSAAGVVAALSALGGCTQLRTHDTLASLLADRQSAPPQQPAKAEREPNAIPPNATPREDDGRAALPPYVIGVTDVLTIEAVVKDPKTGTTERFPEQPVAGRFVVGEDGTVDLGVWGSVSVAGLTTDDASAAIRKQLAESPLAAAVAGEVVVTLDVHARNSKRFYVITQAPDKAEQVHAFPLTGTETVLDAVAGVEGLAEVATRASIRIVRKRDDGTDEVLPVDWRAITENGVTHTNYQLQPADRVYVTRK